MFFIHCIKVLDKCTKFMVCSKKKNFVLLFAFVSNVLNFSFRVSVDKAIAGLIGVLLETCLAPVLKMTSRQVLTSWTLFK